MNFKLELKIAGRYLRARKKEGFASAVTILSFLGIMLGVATLIVTMAVMNGVKTELIKRIIGINAHISVASFEGNIQNYDELNSKIKNISGVKFSNPAVYGQALAVINGENIGLMVRGIRKDDLLNKKILANSVVAGEIYQDNSFEVLAGAYFARQTNLSLNDNIKLLSPSFNSSFFGSIPRIKDFEVSGVFNVGMFEYDSSILFIPLSAGQKFFNLGDAVNQIEVFANDPLNLDNIKMELTKIIPKGTFISDWRKANQSFLSAIDVQSNVLFLILALIILVAVFNIISGMVMLVGDKNKEIAILRTIGMKKFSIIRVFVICGSVIGITGTIFGVILGLSFAANIEEIRRFLESITDTNLFAEEIYFLSQLPAEVRKSDVIKISSLAVFLTLLSTIYPAYKASKIEPATALKYE
ncbi:MAG: lipoprotein-releasing ABC transporter permease subunit [Rickettsiales bacterium]|nr:lipoprotein-releasing ABC transporter permease subunit [Rickettsiales bacterium]